MNGHRARTTTHIADPRWQRARKYYGKQQFNPGALGLFLNPFFLARRSLWRGMSSLSKSFSGRLLDVGCGTLPYRSLFTSASTYVGLDIDSEVSRQRAAAHVLYDGRQFPFHDGSFDSAICNQVLEHVFTPDHFLMEIHRVLVPRGRLLLTVPFVWDEHEQPADFARYSSFGVRALLDRNGFRVIEHRKLLADASVLFQLANAYLCKVVNTRHLIAHVIATALLMAPISMLGVISARLLPSNPDLFLDHLVLAEARG